MKGQAAIEYLMTYGWMLAAVAMVSGVVYTSTGASLCSDSVSGFTGQSLRVEDFGLSSDSANMMISVENQDSQAFYNQLKEIKIENRDTGETIVKSPSAQIINPGSTKVFNINGFEDSNECNSFNVKLTYDRSGVLPNQKAAGTITTTAEIFSESYDPYNPAEDEPNLETSITGTNSPVEEGDTLEVDYTVENTGTKTGDQTIEFSFNGVVEDSTNTNLDPGSSTSGTFTHTPTSQGDYNIEISSSNTTSTQTATVNAPSIDFGVSNINTPDIGYLDTAITASADITSYGPSSNDNAQLRLGSDINGVSGSDYEVIAFKQKNLDSETKTVTFNTNLDSAEASTGTGQEIGIEYENKISNKTIDIYSTPEITDFTITDNSRCNGFFCFNDDVEYDVSWQVNNPGSNLNEANISINGVEEYQGQSGSETYPADGGNLGDQYTFKIQASYNGGVYLCQEVTDTANDGGGIDGSYTDCS